MVTNRNQHSSESRAKQALSEVHSNPNKIGASTPYDFTAKNLTPYGGLLPVATMLEKIGFQKLVEETLTVGRITRVMSMYQFILAIVMGIYVGFARLNQLRYIAHDPLLAGILKVTHLPPQSTLWRFLNSLHVGIARQIQSIQRLMREAVWAAGNIVLKSVTIDTDTTVHTLYGKQMGGRKSYNPKNKGKKSYQPILSFLAETREFLAGELRNGDRPTGKQIARHLQEVFQALPRCVVSIFARADSGFYCWEAVEAYEKFKCSFMIVARKTSRLLNELIAAEWKPSPRTDAAEQCEFRYQPKGWGKAYRFLWEAIAEIFLLLVAAHVHKRKHGNRRLRFAGSLGLPFLEDLLQCHLDLRHCLKALRGCFVRQFRTIFSSEADVCSGVGSSFTIAVIIAKLLSPENALLPLILSAYRTSDLDFPRNGVRVNSTSTTFPPRKRSTQAGRRVRDY
jgi:hypothetical protein